MNEEQIKQIQDDLKIIKVENHIQTAAVFLFFFFGVATIYDISKKINK